jgi:hypothetical protein
MVWLAIEVEPHRASELLVLQLALFISDAETSVVKCVLPLLASPSGSKLGLYLVSARPLLGLG